jgi:hypothetical protein
LQQQSGLPSNHFEQQEDVLYQQHKLHKITEHFVVYGLKARLLMKAWEAILAPLHDPNLTEFQIKLKKKNHLT